MSRPHEHGRLQREQCDGTDMLVLPAQRAQPGVAVPGVRVLQLCLVLPGLVGCGRWQSCLAVDKPGSCSLPPAVDFPLPAPDAALIVIVAVLVGAILVAVVKGDGEGVIDTAALDEELDGVEDDPLLLLDCSLAVLGGQQPLCLWGAGAGRDDWPPGRHVVRGGDLGEEEVRETMKEQLWHR